MITHLKYYLLIIQLFTSLNAQRMQNATEIGTVGAFLGGELGTHAIHSNPALLGIKSGESIERTLIDTFKISYNVELARSDNKNELEEIKNNLNQDGFERDYRIVKKDSLFSLFTYGFKNSFTAFNFSSGLPLSVPLKTIYTDTTWETLEKPKRYYSVQVFSTLNQDTLKNFKKMVKEKLKGFHTKIILTDSLYKFYVGLFDTEEQAVMLKNDPTIQNIDEDSFIVSYVNTVPNDFSPKFSLTFPIRLLINIQNNSLNTNWLNKYLGTDMVQNPSIKTELIKSIPSSGISSSLFVNSGILDMTYLNYGLSLFNINAYSSMKIPKELTKIIFDGVRFNEVQNISNFDSKGYIFNETTFSIGKKLNLKQLPFTTYLGFGIRYLTGLFSYTESYEGSLTTKEDSVILFSDMKIAFTDSNQIASGFGFDLGAYGQINEKTSVQFSLIGIGSYLKSKQASVWRGINKINLSNSDITEILDYNDTQMDSINKTFLVSDTINFINNLSIMLPAQLNVAASYNYSSKIHIKGAMKYITQTNFIGKIPPQVSLGIELFPKKRYSWLGGFSFGGINKINFGLGLELKVKNFCFNIAGGQSGGIFNSAKGFKFSSEFRLSF